MLRSVSGLQFAKSHGGLERFAKKQKKQQSILHVPSLQDPAFHPRWWPIPDAAAAVVIASETAAVAAALPFLPLVMHRPGAIAETAAPASLSSGTLGACLRWEASLLPLP